MIRSWAVCSDHERPVEGISKLLVTISNQLILLVLLLFFFFLATLEEDANKNATQRNTHGGQ